MHYRLKQSAALVLTLALLGSGNGFAQSAPNDPINTPTTDPITPPVYYDPTTDPNFNPNDPSTWPASYNPNDPTSKPIDPSKVPDIDPNLPNWQTDGSSGSSSFQDYLGAKVSTYADKVKSDVESLIGEYEDQILAGLTDALESFLMNQLQNLLGTSPLRAVENLKKLMKDAYTKQQKIDYQQLKVDLAEQKGNTELSDGFAQYYKNLKLKDHAKVVEKSIALASQMVNTTQFTTDEQTQLNEALGLLGDMSDIVGEIKLATNTSKTTAYMAEADRMKILDDNLRQIQKRYLSAEKIRAQIKAVFAHRIKDKQRLKIYDDLIGTEDQLDGGGPRVRRAR